MNKSKYDPLWANPQHWKLHLIYVCKSDPRIIVPKKPKWMGRTLNFAHTRAYVVLLLSILAIVVPATLFPWAPPVVSIPLFLAAIAAVVIFYYSTDLEIKK
jgi:hypothetical protein